jgi:hypothetical protein
VQGVASSNLVAPTNILSADHTHPILAAFIGPFGNYTRLKTPMRSRTPQFVAFLSLAGCASVTPPPAAPKPDAPVAAPAQPAAIAPEPSPPPPSAQSLTPSQTSPPVQSSSPVHAPQAPNAAPAATAPKSTPQAAVAPQPKSVAPAPVSQQQPVAPPTLDLASLEQRLRDTKAIGVFTKLSLKNQVDDLLNDFRLLYKNAKRPGPEMRQRYDLLLLKVLTLLQDGDPPLASAIASSKEAIWNILSDPDKLAKI